MAIIRNFRLPVGVGISADYIETFGVIQSTSPLNGAIVSRGGVGVGNSISVGGRLQLFSGANYTAFQSSAIGNTVYFLPATSPATGSSVLQSTSAGVMSWVPMVPNYSVSAGTATTATYAHQSGYGITAGFATTASYSYQSGYGLTSGIATTATNINVVLASTSASHQLLFTPTSGSASGVAVSSNSTLVYNPSTDRLSVSGLAVTSTTASTSSSSGALTVSGGVGIGGSLYVSSATAISGVNINNGVITAGSWAGNLITGNYGGTGYSTYTKGDLLVGVGSTLVKVGIGASHQVLSYSSTSSSGLGWTDLSISSPISTNYGCFYSTSTQPVIGADTITPITVNSTYEASNIQIYGGAGTSSRIRILNGGVYNIQLSTQMNLTTGNQAKVTDFWFRINGSDVPWSNSKQTILGQDNQHIFSLNFVSTFTAGQYFEVMMSSTDSAFILEANAAGTGPTRPATPSVIYTVTKVL